VKKALASSLIIAFHLEVLSSKTSNVYVPLRPSRQCMQANKVEQSVVFASTAIYTRVGLVVVQPVAVVEETPKFHKSCNQELGLDSKTCF
jgi:hypothetical protein